MPSTYSSLKIELIATGEQSGTWGATTNTNLGTAIEEAITGSADVTFTNGNDTTITLTDTNAAQAARNLRLNLVGSSTGAQNLILGSGCQIEKLYLINNTLGHTITVKNTTGTGVAVPAGKKAVVYNDGTNVVNAIDYFATADIAGGTINNTVIGGTTPAAGTFTQVNIPAQGDLRLEDTSGGQYVALQAPATVASSYTLTMPVDDGTNGQALITDGNGNLSWSTAASGDVYGPASATDNAVVRFDSTTGKLIKNSGVIIDNSNNVTGVADFTNTGNTTLGDASGDTLTINGTTVTTPNGLNFDSNTFVIDATNDRVGINTSSPSARLDVHRSGSSTGLSGVVANPQLAVTNAGNWGNSTGMLFRAPLTSGGAISNNAAVWAEWSADNNAYLAFATNGSGTLAERMRITSTGLVGIGTSSPSENLDVSASVNGGGPTINVSNTYYLAGSTDEFAEFQAEFYQDDVAARRAAGYMRFGKSGDFSNNANASAFLSFATRNAGTVAERMRIDSSGNVGINTTNPTASIVYNANTRILGIAGTGAANANSFGGISLQNNRATPAAADVIGTVDFVSANNTAPIKVQIASVLEGSGGGTGGFGGVLSFSTRADNSASVTERMRIDSSGNVLVGSTTVRSSSTKFLVSSASSVNYLEIQNTSGSGSSGISDVLFSSGSTGAFGTVGYDFSTNAMRFATNSAERMRITSTGNVGIGTSSPTTSLTISKSAASAYINATDGTVNNYFGVANSSSSGWVGTITNHSLGFATNNTVKATLDASGNLGIGVSTLANFGTGRGVQIATSAASQASSLYLQNGTTGTSGTDGLLLQMGPDNTSGYLWNYENGTLVFATNNTERMRIDSSGNVLINTTSTVGGQRLSINGGIGLLGSNTNQQLDFYRINGTSIVASGNTVAQILARGYNGSSYDVMASIVMAVDGTPGASNDMPGRIVFSTTADGSATPTERMRIDSSGNVGIGTSSPNYLINTSRANTTLYAPLSEATRVPSATMAMFVNTNTADGSYSGISFQVSRTAGTNSAAYLGAVSTTSNPHIVFGQRDASNELYTERMRITSAGEVLVGGTTEIQSADLTVQRTNGSAGINLYRNDTSVVATDVLGRVEFYGNDTTSNTPTNLAYIRAAASGTHAAGDNPTDLVFGTTPDGTETIAEAGRITQSGAYVLKGGTTTAAAGVGIIFPATQVASADVNCLDDYEEGTWTVGVKGSTTAGTYTALTANASYTKIGRQVTCNFYVRWESGTGTGNLLITGLPFTSRNASGFYYAGSISSANINYTAGNTLSLFLAHNTTEIEVNQIPPNSATIAVPYDAGDALIIGNITYFV